MAEGLPEGLVRNREGVTAVGDGIDRIDPELLAACWQIYSSNKAVLAENIGRRLENFFWRIWSSDRLQQRLTGSQVNVQFDIINEGGYIRTTPTPSPRSSKSLSVYYREIRPRTPPITPPAVKTSENPTSYSEAESSAASDSKNENSTTFISLSTDAKAERPTDDGRSPASNPSRGGTRRPSETLLSVSEKLSEAGKFPGHGGPEDSSVTPTPISPIAALDKSRGLSKENRRTPQIPTRRPPILKKEGSSGSSRSSKSAKIALPSLQESRSREASLSDPLDDDESSGATPTQSSTSRRMTATRFNEEVAVSIPKRSAAIQRNTSERSTRSGGEGNPKAGKRNPIVTASTATNRKRPSFVRQRSSTGTPTEVLSRSLSSQNLYRGPKAHSPSSLLESRSTSESKQILEPTSTKFQAALYHPSRQASGQSPEATSGEESSEEADLYRTEAQDISKKSPDRQEYHHNISPASSTKTKALKPIVDPDFRAKFIDRTQASQRSMTDISSLTRKSSAAVPTSASYHATGMLNSMQAISSTGKGQGKEAFTNVTAPLKAPAPAGPEFEVGESAAPLPRIKSQLSLLLEREKGRSTKEPERSTRRSEP